MSTDGVMRRRPLRVQLTAAFTLSMALVLVIAGLLVTWAFQRDLDARIDDRLASGERTVRALAADPRRTPRDVIAEAGEQWLQLYAPAGGVLASSREVGTQRLLPAPAARRAAAGQRATTDDERAGAVDDGLRLRAFPVRGGSAVVASPLDAREQSLHRFALTLILTLTLALALATLAGWIVAGRALRPVEAMRLRASQLAAGDSGEQLPEPQTGDELQRLAETLNALIAAQRAAIEQERRIVADASHELRTPVSVLRTRLDVALRSGRDDPAQLRQVLQDAHGDALRLSRLADDLLLLARADQGELPVSPQPCSADDLLGAAAERHAVTAGAAGRSITTQVDAATPALLADPDRTAQLLDNLIANALRHGDGTIELTAAAGAGNTVELAVRDHGSGFGGPTEPLLARFSQGAGAPAGGSGLGLAIAVTLAAAQGGTLTARDASGGGAKVTVTLPAV